MKFRFSLILILAAAFFQAPLWAKGTITKSGLKIEDTKPGVGPTAIPGKMVSVQYTGWLYVNGKKGKKFDSSLDRKKPFDFQLGGGQVIPGWDEGIQGMQVGGQRILIIPANLAYGAHGAGAVIPPNADLIFDIELLAVK